MGKISDKRPDIKYRICERRLIQWNCGLFYRIRYGGVGGLWVYNGIPP